MTRMIVGTAWLVLGALAGFGTEFEKRIELAGDNAAEIRGFVAAAKEGHGEFGEKAAVFLVEGMPARDLKALKEEFLVENLDLAMKARAEFPWAKEVPEEVYLNDVLPYASLDETRESWRPSFDAQCKDLVKDCKTSTQAAQAINRELFNLIKVHYNTGRKAPKSHSVLRVQQKHSTSSLPAPTP